MKPSDDELKKVGDALVTLNLITFSPKERQHMSHFLHSCAIEYNEHDLKKVFKSEHGPTILDAMKTLNNFANDYQDHEIIHEFHDEIIDLLINVNDEHGSMVI